MIGQGTSGPVLSLAKLALAAGKAHLITTIPLALTLGVSVLVIASGAMYVAQKECWKDQEFEDTDKEKLEAERRRDT